MDIQGMMSLFINCQHFYSSNHIGRQDLFEELKRIRNNLFHSGTFNVSDTDLQTYLQTILCFLQGMTDLTRNERERLQVAVDRVEQLKANVIEITMKRHLEIEALQQGQIELERSVMSEQKEEGSESTDDKHNENTLQELQKAKKNFDAFLQQNNLEDCVRKLSTDVAVLYQRLNTIEESWKPGADTTAVRVKHVSESNKKERISAISKLDSNYLQQLLVHMYKSSAFWRDPVTSEEAFLSKLYVKPSVKRIREQDKYGRMAEIKSYSLKLTYDQIFLSKARMCENVYVTANAGAGKTTFCNNLVREWCSAVGRQSDETLAAEDSDVLSNFQFVFFIELRNFETTYQVEDMIKKQLSCHDLDFDISEILKTECCLIVLDGLDEWSCPEKVQKCPNMNRNIPGRNTANRKCVFLTTTRNWKFDFIALENKDIDKHVEFGGIDENSSRELAHKMLDYLGSKSQTRKAIDDFYHKVNQKNLKELLYVPVLLIQLITLWHFGKDFGNSQLQLYCSMLELLFERSEKNLPEETSTCSVASDKRKELPGCFIAKPVCKQHSTLLHCLGKLAYKSLFNEQREDALVFRLTQMDLYGISISDIKLCLKCDLLSQSKDYVNYTGKYKRLSFLHKKMQEFLAALYIVTNDTVEDTLKEIKQFCNSLETMLEMNQVWLFVAGMECDITRQLFEHLAGVAGDDAQVRRYRQTLDYVSLIDVIQISVSECLLEGKNNNQHHKNVCLEDIRIVDRPAFEVKKMLLCTNMPSVKSLHIRPGETDQAVLEVIANAFQQCHSLQKLHIYDHLPPRITCSTTVDLVDNNSDSLTSLYLWTDITATDKLVNAICSSISNCLMALRLVGVTMRHEQKEQILNSLSKSPFIRQLILTGMPCTDHGYMCRPRLDLSSMKSLQELSLYDMSLQNLHCLPQCVEDVKLGQGVTLSVESFRDFSRVISQSSSGIIVQLDQVTFTETREECGNLRDFLQRCSGLKLEDCKYVYEDNTWQIKFHKSGE